MLGNALDFTGVCTTPNNSKKKPDLLAGKKTLCRQTCRTGPAAGELQQRNGFTAYKALKIQVYFTDYKALKTKYISVLMKL